MPKEYVFRARIDRRQQAKVEQLLRITGLNQSKLLRHMLEQIEVTNSHETRESILFVTVDSKGEQHAQ